MKFRTLFFAGFNPRRFFRMASYLFFDHLGLVMYPEGKINNLG
jgi:hypothetical protein